MDITKIEKKLEKEGAHVRILCEWGYYKGTYSAPKDGYLRDVEPCYGGNGKEYFLISTFGTVEAALEAINELNLSATYEIDEDKGEFTPISGTQYLLRHGQYSAPSFKICVFNRR